MYGSGKLKMGIQVNSTAGTVSKKECGMMLCPGRLGPGVIERYHRAIRKVIGVKCAFSFGSGRGALYALLKACNVGAGDEVVVQGYTCVAVPKAVIYAGALPVYADITRADYNLSYDSVASRITDKTKAVIVQHTYGIPCHAIYRIKELCKSKHILLIEDCAHTFGVKYGKDMLGTIGDASFYSTDNTKYISTGAGGIAVTNDPKIAERLEEQYKKAGELTAKELFSIRVAFVLDYIRSDKHIMYITETSLIAKIIRATLLRSTRKVLDTYDLSDYDNMDYPTYTFPAKLSRVQAKVGLSQIRKLGKNI